MNPSTPKPAGERVVIVNNTRRDALIAAVAGFLVLGFILYGISSFMSQSNQARSNTVTGIVIEKQFTAAPEQQISVGGKGLKIREIDGEYLLKVKAGPEERIYEVPVEKSTYQLKNVGDSLTFLKPSSG